MKYSYLALDITLLSALASAQTHIPTHIPYCAEICIANAIADSTTCAPKDLWCQCSNVNLPVIVNASTTCVEKACKDPEAVLVAARNKCSSVLTHNPTPSSSVSETASSTVATTWTSSIPDPTREAIIVGYSGLPTSECGCELEPAKVISSPTVANNSTYTTSSTPLKITGGASHFAVNAGSVFAVGMAALIAL